MSNKKKGDVSPRSNFSGNTFTSKAYTGTDGIVEDNYADGGLLNKFFQKLQAQIIVDAEDEVM